jgi:hypothetical protein
LYILLFVAAEKPNVTSTSKADALAADSSTRHQGFTQKEVARSKKLANSDTQKERDLGQHVERVDEPKRLSQNRTRTRTLSPREVRVARGGPGTGVESERPKQEQKEIAQNMATVSAATITEEGGGTEGKLQEDDDGDYEYEDDFEVS